MFDIITFGSAVVDAFAYTNAAEKKGFMYYPVGAKILLKDLKFSIGGGGTNTAVAFSRLGLKTGYIGKVGDDDAGRNILDLLKKEKIEFLGKVDNKGVTGYSIVLDSREHDRTILAFKGINNTIKLSDIDLNNAKSKWIYFSSLMGESFKTQIKLAEILHRKGVKIAFNPSDYLIKEKNLKPLLKICDVIVFNKEESELLAGKENTLQKVYEMGPKIVVVTDKDKMITAYDGNKFYHLKPHKVKVVERTGAGDAFASGFVAGQMVGWSVEKSLALGLRESESVITHVGSKNKLLRMKLR
ncbi:MAG: carbohydrate kinase family protein [Nanoarchaeota archaeon]